MWKQLSILAIYSLNPDLPATPAGSTVFHYFLRSPFLGAVFRLHSRDTKDYCLIENSHQLSKHGSIGWTIIGGYP